MKVAAKEHGFATVEEFGQHDIDEFQAQGAAYKEHMRDRYSMTE